MGTNIITPKFIEKMRSSDYQGTSYAFAEIIDNSFDADATIVKITCIERRDTQNKRYIHEVIFSDNGTGMDDYTLNNCLTFAFGTNEDLAEVLKKKKIGKFGMGLPNSSISQCKDIQVYSKTPETSWRRKYLKIKELLDSGSTELPDFEETPLPKHFGEADILLNKDHGTIISWKDCDRLDRQFADTLFKRAEGILGRLFRYHLANGGKIILSVYAPNAQDESYVEQSKIEVVLNDPLFLTPNAFITRGLRDASIRDASLEEKNDPAIYYTRFISGLPAGESRPTSVKLEDHSYVHKFEWNGKEYSFSIKTSYAHIDIQKPGIRDGGRTRVGNVYGEKMKNGNIYFTRHQREISCGHYNFYNLSSENNRWWSIEIDFAADADELFGVSNTKQGIKFTKTIDDESSINFDKHTASLQQAKEKLWFEVSNRITKSIKSVTKILSDQAKQFEESLRDDEGDNGSPVPTGTDQTSQAIKNTDKQRPGRFDADQKVDLIEALQKNFPNLTELEISNAVERFDKSLVRGCIIYCPLDNDQLWAYNSVRNFLVIYINTNHDFYNNIIAQFRTARFDSALAAIELFISSLAWEQSEHFDNDKDKKRNLDNFRTYVGIHLNNYLEENNIKVTLEDLESFNNDDVV